MFYSQYCLVMVLVHQNDWHIYCCGASGILVILNKTVLNISEMGSLKHEIIHIKSKTNIF